MLEEIGQKIKEYRERAGISQKKLGMLLGLSDKAISAYENGRTPPPLDTLCRIAEELDIPVYYFFNDDKPQLKIDERLTNVERSISKLMTDISLLRELLTKYESSNKNLPTE